MLRARMLQLRTMITRTMTADDYPAVAAIYAEGILTGNATFQQDVPSWESWDAAHVKNCRLVAMAGDELACFILRTTGFNSIRTLATRLRYFAAGSGGLLAGWRASSSVSGKTTFSVAGLTGMNVAGSVGHA